MIKRLVAWCIALAVAYGVYVGATTLKNPWSGVGGTIGSIVPAPSVLDALPPAYTGCTEGCK